MKSNRLIWADSLKGILILLVLLGHAIQFTIGVARYSNHLWNMIYSFHMPAFMAVSGFFAYRTGGGDSVLQTIWRRFQQLMIPYLLWSILFMLIDGSLKIGWIQQLLMYPDKGLWFLWALFFITVIFQICGWMAGKFKVDMAIIVTIVGTALVMFMVIFKIKLFGFQFIAYYFIFYAAAYFFHKYYEKVMSLKKGMVALMAVIWFVLAWFWQMHEIPPFLSWVPIPATIVQYLYRFATALIAIYILFAVSPKLLNSVNKWNRPIVNLGKISLGIYSINFFVLGNIVPLLKEEGLNNSMTILFSFILGTICAWAIIWMLSQWKVPARHLLGKI